MSGPDACGNASIGAIVTGAGRNTVGAIIGDGLGGTPRASCPRAILPPAGSLEGTRFSRPGRYKPGPGGFTGNNGGGFSTVRGLTGGGAMEVGASGGNPTASINRRILSSSLSGGAARGVLGLDAPPPDCRPAAAASFEMITMITTNIGKKCAIPCFLPCYFTSSCARSGPAIVSRIFVSASTLRIFI